MEAMSVPESIYEQLDVFLVAMDFLQEEHISEVEKRVNHSALVQTVTWAEKVSHACTGVP